MSRVFPTPARQGRNDDIVVDDFADILYDFSKLNHEERVHNKTVAKTLAELADWSILITNYIEAHNKALSNSEKKR